MEDVFLENTEMQEYKVRCVGGRGKEGREEDGGKKRTKRRNIDRDRDLILFALQVLIVSRTPILNILDQNKIEYFLQGIMYVILSSVYILQGTKH